MTILRNILRQVWDISGSTDSAKFPETNPHKAHKVMTRQGDYGKIWELLVQLYVKMLYRALFQITNG